MKFKFINSWVFLDRDCQADDNAEHLYRYVQKNHGDKSIFFLLRKNSKDWLRLKESGFSLIPFGSLRHMILMFCAKHLLSSHADGYVYNFPPNKWLRFTGKYYYTFLQHGVINHNLSGWLNKKPIDRFITTTESEYDSIVKNNSLYKFTSKEVRLTGLARHDELLNLANKIPKLEKKTLLIMPTWRENIVGDKKWMSNDRQSNNSFFSTQYARAWKGLLQSKELKKLVVEEKMKVVFFPHVNIEPYINGFGIPSYVDLLSHSGIDSIQNILVESSIMITDYSSIAFDVALLEKPIIYYQFDNDSFFTGDHITKKGYFNYHEDGFGPICGTKEGVLKCLRKQIESDLVVGDKYLARMKSTFKYKDGNNCKRIYESILDLEKL